MDIIMSYRDKLERAIEKYPCINNTLIDLEKKTNVKKVYIAYGVYILVIVIVIRLHKYKIIFENVIIEAMFLLL